MKSVAPKTSARIREAVNTDPDLSKIIQFNANGATVVVPPAPGAPTTPGARQPGLPAQMRLREAVAKQAAAKKAVTRPPGAPPSLAIVLSLSPAGTALDVAEGSQQALDAFLKGENMDGFLELGGIALDTVKAEKVKAAARALAPGAVDALSDMVRKSAPLRAAKGVP